MDAEIITDALKSVFGRELSVRPRRPGIYQINLPSRLIDGDETMVFVRGIAEGRVVVTDLRHTLMRASYSHPLTAKMVDAVERLVRRNGFEIIDGEVCASVPMSEFLVAIFGMVQIQAQAEVAVVAPLARADRSDKFKQGVVEAIRAALHGVEENFVDRSVDPEGLFPVDLIVPGRRWVNVAIVGNDNDASTATMAKLKHMQSAKSIEHRPFWVVVPRDLESLTKISRRRMISEFLPLTDAWMSATPDEVTSKIRDLAEPSELVSARTGS